MQYVCAKDGMNGRVPMGMTVQAVQRLQYGGEDFINDFLKMRWIVLFSQKVVLYR